MLVIRKEQMEALSSVIRQSFIDRLVTHLKSEFPDKVAELPPSESESADEPLQSLIVRLTNRAAELDIISERDVARFIDFCMEFGEGFEKDRDMRWAAKILVNKRLSGSARVSLMYEQLPYKVPDSRLVKR